MTHQEPIPKFFQDMAPQWARLALWQKKFSAAFDRLRGSTLQKISASDDGFLVLNLYKPGASREPVLISVQRTGSGVSVSPVRPQTQPKPNSIVQIARKYLQGRKVTQVTMSLSPVLVVIEFAAVAQAEQLTPTKQGDEAPNCLVIDLDHRPARVCVATLHTDVPQRYQSQCSGFGSGDAFFESHCEWSLENTKTKRRATLTQPVVLSCLLPSTKQALQQDETPAATETPPLDTGIFHGNQASVAAHYPSALLQAQGPTQSLNSEATVPEEDDKALTLQGALNVLPTHVRRTARTRLQFLERRLHRQKTDLPSPSELSALKKRAEGLRANIYLWPQGFPQWHVPPDLIESASLPPIISLKPGQSPGDIVSASFEELDKMNRRCKELERRVEESRAALERFQSLVLQAGSDVVSLPDDVRRAQVSLAREVENLVSVQRLLSTLEVTWTVGQQKSAALAAEKQRRLPYRTYSSSTGEFLRVSKSAADADAMLKLMPSHHTWVHVMTGEGSHVWLEKPKGAKPSAAALREAAMLAIHHSKLSRAQEADVYIALRGDLDRRKDLPSGKVLVRRSEHRFVRYTQAELQTFLERQE